MSAKDEISVKISWCSKKEKSFSPTFFFVALVFPAASRLLTILLGQKRERDKKNFHQLLNRGCKIRRNRRRITTFCVLIFRKEIFETTKFCVLDSVPASSNDVKLDTKEGNRYAFWHNGKHKHQSRQHRPKYCLEWKDNSFQRWIYEENEWKIGWQQKPKIFGFYVEAKKWAWILQMALSH